MRVRYQARRTGRDLHAVYEPVGVRFCCARMKRHWGRLIGFGAPGCLRSTSREVNLVTPRPQAGGRAVVELTAIDHCPFCAAAIRVCKTTTRPTPPRRLA